MVEIAFVTVCFKIKDTSPIVSLLFWLNGDLLNLWGKSRLIVTANEFTRLSKIEINCVILNAIYWKKINFVHHSPPACLHGNQKKTTNAK